MLTDSAIRAAKPADKLFKLSDSSGLQLWISPEGSKYWRLAYRFGGKQRVFSIGKYPNVSLKAARAASQNARSLLDAGKDPNQTKKAEMRAVEVAASSTFAAVAAEFLAKKEREHKAPATLKRLNRFIEFAGKDLGTRPISSITAPEVLAVLRKIEERGKLVTAARLRAVTGEIFRYAIATGRAENDPTFALRGALTSPVTKHRAAIVEPLPFGALLRAIETYEGTAEVAAALNLLALTFVRPGELRNAAWAEFDLEAAYWLIPPGRMKMRRSHRVPLAPQALATLKRLQAFTGHGKLLFPSARSPDRCMSENTINAALRRLGYGQNEMTGHGFRAAASSMLNETGKWNPDAIEAQLAHVNNNSIRRAYARAEYWEERVEMMTYWADRIDAMRRGAEIVQLRA